MSPVAEQNAAPKVHPLRLPARATDNDLPNLDFLRTVAVSLVFLNHLGFPLNLRGVAALGHLGVLLFFVHTALVLMMSMERLHLTGTKLYSAFMIRRIFRIYPLSIVSILALLAFSLPADAWGVHFVWPSTATLLSNFALVQNITGAPSINAVLWSLPFEVQMYALLPLLYLWLRRSKSLGAALAGWAVAMGLALAEYWIRGAGPELEQSALARYFPCFMGGLLAWQLLKRSRPSLPGWLWPGCLFGFVAAYRLIWALRGFGLGALLHWSRFHGGTGRNWPLYVDFITEGVLCALVGLSIPWFRQIGARWIRTASRLVARYSYGVYLFHSAAIWLCFTRWSTGITSVNIADSILLTAVISIILYHLIEDPFIGWGKRVAAVSTRRAVAAPPPYHEATATSAASGESGRL